MVHILPGEKYVLHSVYKKEFDGSLIKKAKFISDNIDEAFKQRGIKFLYTWSETTTEDRYNKFLGFEPTGDIVHKISDGGVLPDDYPNEIREYIKCL